MPKTSEKAKILKFLHDKAVHELLALDQISKFIKFQLLSFTN